jgi:hypothetical protein
MESRQQGERKKITTKYQLRIKLGRKQERKAKRKD